MRFKDFIGNAKVVTRLRSKLREGRLPHALIFAGPEGVGKRTCALLFAKALNCRESAPDDFCDACSQCRKIDAGVHPDVLVTGLEEEASEIKIVQIRDLLQTLGMRPLEGIHKVFIIDPADAMNAAAANALLKGLEEPPEDTHFMLLTSNPQSLLLTVRSRCQTYAFARLTLEEMRQFGGDELAIRWSRGSIGTLRKLDLSAVRQRREAALDFLELAVRAKDQEFRDLISASADLARAKNDFEENLSTIAVLMEDLLYIREGLPHLLVNIDLEARLKKLGEDIPPTQFPRIAEFLRTIEVHLNNYGNRQMLTDVLALTSNTVLSKIANDNASKSR
ncbi:MAG TPA: DNA polymerase III subunit delta' [Terriglobia bacterium]|nr:DNA polymerase III subunit delta' [Terriglobia bacterium]